ncbi:DUF1772 domain-containing protein [Micromonospora rosaria]|uniref:DUF1772 domain-containing protein n=1 Tax=Micromonospora rosaria TaxID=47874 RepID=UPI001FDF2D3D|nr:DUF1772 domain-containing protein [Micromonospora rosaria]
MLAVVAVVGSGLTAGVLVSTMLGIIPFMRTLPPDRYVAAHRYLWSRYDPFMPICFGLSVLADLVLAVRVTDPTVRTPVVLATVCLAAVMVISVTRQVPINRWVRDLDPAALPLDWAEVDPRRRWRNWNLARTVLACAGFGLNVVVLTAMP